MNSDISLKTIEQKLIEHVSAILSAGVDQVSLDTPLHTLGVDSLGFVELLVFIEKEFKVKLMESGMVRDDFRTIRSLAKCIDKTMA
ncbi:MAG: acyl carrier protein [Candidatus Omnitrophica bacterium]|nr:acyl carrier protein [Candidatus Omnitrophota bacterium]